MLVDTPIAPLIEPRISLFTAIRRAVYRARWSILSVALAYAITVMIGMIMAHSGSAYALNTRDAIVGTARASAPSLQALQQGDRLRASFIDFTGNLFRAVTNTVEGIAVIFPYPFVAYRGWVGGIVSVDAAHHSRLADPREAAYYLITLILQIVPYSLAGGAGVHLGISNLRLPDYYRKQRFLTLPRDALMDVLRIYLLIVPLFLIASLWEFLAR